MDPSPTQAPEGPGGELERLGQELAVRSSITLFAVGFGCAIAAVVTFGMAVRLLVDSLRLPWIFYPLAVLAVLFIAGALFGMILGRQRQLTERAKFRHYLELRAQAGLD